MMKPLRTAFVLIPLTALALSGQFVNAAQLSQAFTGNWVGTLEYKDYRNPDLRVTLPTILDVSPLGAGVKISFTYDDGPGKTVTGEDHFTLSADGKTLDWTGVKEKTPEIFTVLSLRRDAATRTITLVGAFEGDDNNKPATIHETLTIGPSELTILKEVRPTGGEFSFRHLYRMKKQ